MAESKWSYIVPSVATVLAASITAYVAFLAMEVSSRDLGSIDDGQKLCVVAKTGVWHNITVIPQNWSVSMCKQLGDPFESDAFYIGCAFSTKHVFGGKNEVNTPNPNCGW